MNDNLNENERAFVDELSIDLHEQVESDPEKKERNSRKMNLVCAISGLLLSSLAILNIYSLVRVTGRVDIFYVPFALVGFISSILVALKFHSAHWFLLTFFLMQSIFVYSEDFYFKFSPGLALPVGWYSGVDELGVVQHPGFAINLIGLTLALLSIYCLKRRK